MERTLKIKKIKTLQFNDKVFKVIWNKEHNGGALSYGHGVKEPYIEIGTKCLTDKEMLEIILHELMELVALAMYVRHNRSDVDSDYIFVYDHRQHATMMSMMAGLVSRFIA